MLGEPTLRKPVALLECRRALHGRTLEDAVQSVITLNNGFQLEMIACLAAGLKIKAYLVAIKDDDPENAGYGKATFQVVEVVPPQPWPQNRQAVAEIRKLLGKPINYSEQEYANFLALL